MQLIKIVAVLFIFLIPIACLIIAKVLRFSKFGLNFADIAYPIFIWLLYSISDRAFYHSLLPEWGLALSLLAIFITIYSLRKKRAFYYPRFLKLFWRAGFLVTYFLYIAMVISLFIV